MRLIVAFLILFCWSIHASAEDAREEVGAEYQITLRHVSEEKDSEGGSGSSSGTDTIVEHVIAVREDGFELEYGFPKEASAQERATTWQLPVRIFMPFEGEAKLLNAAELEARVDPWLRKASWNRKVCGQWIFTWNAFKIDCDPQSALGIVKQFDLRSNKVGNGLLYSDALADQPKPMSMTSSDSDEVTYFVKLAVDPEIVQKERAESDVVGSGIVGTKITLEDALHAQKKNDISGSIEVTLRTAPDGRMLHRERVIKLKTIEPDGKIEDRVSTETWDVKRLQ